MFHLIILWHEDSPVAKMEQSRAVWVDQGSIRYTLGLLSFFKAIPLCLFLTLSWRRPTTCAPSAAIFMHIPNWPSKKLAPPISSLNGSRPGASRYIEAWEKRAWWASFRSEEHTSELQSLM